ncbi:hypothetical protein NST41_28470 [Paenibacillus sp. FSL L8-0696]|uniref:hypothetical protein n=1 Tax=Paenibacillus sp. FSL L8-0696 TaxID=2954524 RepID=UPI003119177B
MYIQNIRDSISELSPEEMEVYLSKLKLILKRDYGKNIKRSDLKDRVNAFVNGIKPSSDYFEAYLLTFDEINPKGALDALQNKKVRFPTTWRELLINVTNDRSLSPEIHKHIEDEHVRLAIKALFYNSIEYCKHQDKEEFAKNLRRFNEFLKIK